MPIVQRITNPQPGQVAIPLHEFAAAIWEFKRGAPGVDLPTLAQVFVLDSTEQTQLRNWYLGQVATDRVDRDLLEDVLILGRAYPSRYTTSVILSRIGLGD